MPSDQNDTAQSDGVILPCPGNKPEHWIEIELADEDGAPVPDVEFRVVLPNGEAVRGYLDSTGSQRFGPFEAAGSCEVSFPNLDERSVRPG
ncbi:MAG: hypothetical protein ABI910_07550 [Gemmatimonadota bacterium]